MGAQMQHVEWKNQTQKTTTIGYYPDVDPQDLSDKNKEISSNPVLDALTICNSNFNNNIGNLGDGQMQTTFENLEQPGEGTQELLE